MNQETIHNTLSKLGLNEKEITFYLLLLEMGSAPASILAKRTGTVRSTAQYTCQQLAKKGIVKMIQEKNSYLYSVESPENLYIILQKEKNELEKKNSVIQKKEKEIDSIIGELKTLRNPYAVLPKIQFYENIDGAFQALDSVLKTLQEGDEILSFAKVLDQEYQNDKLWEKINNFLIQVSHKNIYTKSLVFEAKESLELKENDEKYKVETRFIDPQISDFEFEGGEIMIYGNYIYTLTVEKNILFAYIIQSQSAAELYRALFYNLWKKTYPSKT